jgi:hypothetical protein
MPNPEMKSLIRVDGRFESAMPVEERFMQYVDKQESGCWFWTGNRDKDGYGRFTWREEKIKRAHHAAWRIFKGPLPNPRFLMHSCDTPSCVNPDHLSAGNNRKNIDDMMAKNRQLKGEQNAQAKLTDEQAMEIRRRYQRRPSGRPLGCSQNAQCNNSTRALAKEFGVTRRVIQNIIQDKGWRHAHGRGKGKLGPG